jgi:hypothetical protein
VANCGFEDGTYTSTVGGYTNSNVPNSWTANAAFDSEPGFNLVTSALFNSGNYALSIGNFEYQPVASLTQTLTDVAGNLYTVDFYVYYNSVGLDSSAFLTLSAGGGSETVSNSNYLTDDVWQLYGFTFTGTGSDTLSIAGATNPSEWYVDDISVVSNGVTATPLPTALPLFAGGLGALGLFGWRRKRKDAFAPAAA